jgi:hypothetical protein
MSRNGSGTYILPAGNPVVTNTTISSTWANSTLTDIASALTGSVASDGQTAMSSSLNMANNKIISVTDPTNAQDAATKAYVDTADALSLLKANNLSDVANATTSRTNLVAAKSGANSDITSLSGLTTPLTVAQGGIGTNTLTANNVLLGNGTSAPQVVAPSTTGFALRSTGTTWTSQRLGLGMTGEVFSDVTGSRAFFTTYTNSTGYPIMVAVHGISSGVSGNKALTFLINGNAVITNGFYSTTGNNYPSITIIVPNGSTYRADVDGVTLNGWWELR